MDLYYRAYCTSRCLYNSDLILFLGEGMLLVSKAWRITQDAILVVAILTLDCYPFGMASHLVSVLLVCKWDELLNSYFLGEHLRNW